MGAVADPAGRPGRPHLGQPARARTRGHHRRGPAGVDAGAEAHRGRLVVEPDRRPAIARAIGGARPGDVVLIAGKGHETTQESRRDRVPFDDRLVAAAPAAEPVPAAGTGGAEPCSH